MIHYIGNCTGTQLINGKIVLFVLRTLCIANLMIHYIYK
ncbi:unnamed protein product [Arabidopsis halleri]